MDSAATHPSRTLGRRARITATAAAALVIGAMAAAGPASATDPDVTPDTITVTGTFAVGQTVTAVEGTWTPSDVTYSYQWYEDTSTTIPGATSQAYLIPASLRGHTLSVEVTGAKLGWTARSASSSPASVGYGTLAGGAAPTITGTTKVGRTLTANPVTTTPAAGATTYQWAAGAVDIVGATAQTYDLTTAELGKAITVRATGSRTGYDDDPQTSSPTGVVGNGALTTAAPTISGTAQVGAPLTAVPATTTPSPDGTAYQWAADTVDIGGAISSTYVPAETDLGKALTVRVTVTKTGYDDNAQTSSATAVVADGAFTASPPTITGTPTVGQTLNAAAGNTSPTPTATSFQWVADGIDIPGATSSSYTLTGAEAGTAIKVEATATRTGYAAATRTSSATTAVAPGTITSGAPSIDNTAPKVGQVLTATPGTATPGPTTPTYQWGVGGTDVGGATDATYTVAVGDLGKAIGVRVTAGRTGYTADTKTSLPTAAVANGNLSSLAPTVAGTAAVGETLTATPGNSTPSGATPTYRWIADSTDITGATSATYVLTPAELGKVITVRVTATKTGYNPDAQVSAPTATVAAGALSSAAPAITGTAAVGRALTAVRGTASLNGTTPIYQWIAGGTPITGATAPSYTLTPAELGKKITVAVTASKAGYAPSTRTSAATSKVDPGTLTGSAPAISGTPTVGQTLTASSGTWNPTTATRSLQWLRGTRPIPGATGSTYRLTTADSGYAIAVQVTGRLTGYTATTVSSRAKPAVAALFTSTKAPTIGGTPNVGRKLTATVPTWKPATTSVSYRWNRDGVPIAKATKATYALTGLDYKARITVTVTGSRTGYAATPVTSAASAPIGRPAATLKKDGLIEVGSGFPAGTYMSSGGAGDTCYWERRTNDKDGKKGFVASDIGKGQQIVTIARSDQYFYTEGCGTWTKFVALGAPRTTVGDGTWAPRSQVTPGTYRTTTATSSCWWARLSGFPGYSWSGANAAVLDAVSSDAATQTVTVRSGDAGFQTQGCGTWTRIG